MKFDEKRAILLERAFKMKDGIIDNNFEGDFFSLVENVVVGMIQGEDNFFGQFLVKVQRDIRYDITWPLATIPHLQGYKIYFNPLLFLECNKREMIALFKHEIYHIMYGHHERERDLRNKYTTISVNLALDISINQFINNMPPESFRLERFNREFFASLKEDNAIEVYAEEIEKIIKEKLKKRIDSKDQDIGTVINISKAHDAWEESDLNNDAIKEITKKIAISSLRDDAPQDIRDIVNSYNEIPQVSWKGELKRMIPTIRAGTRKTITRKSRRQPERLDIRGKLPNLVPEVIVALDISASMSEKEIHSIMIEILDIAKNRTNKITVIECDNEIRRVYEIRSRKDIKKRSQNNGATKFSPVFEYLKDYKLRNQVLIYFTDGVGEKELEINPVTKNVIWVLTGNYDLSLVKPLGKIKRIEAREKEEQSGTAALDMVKEFQREHVVIR
jgi:predicted metal-dependent peptidase